MPRVAFRAVRGRKVFLRVSKLAKRELEREIDSVVKPHFIREHEAVVTTWKHKPTFKARKFITDDSIRVTISATGPNAKIWRFVSGGTSVRRAVMSSKPKWISKTEVGSLKSGRGQGRVVFIGKHINLPGIQARKFTEQIMEKEKAWFSRTMGNIWKRVIRRL